MPFRACPLCGVILRYIPDGSSVASPVLMHFVAPGWSVAFPILKMSTPAALCQDLVGRVACSWRSLNLISDCVRHIFGYVFGWNCYDEAMLPGGSQFWC